MKYVNPELFMNFDDIKNDTDVAGDFVWLLLAATETVESIITMEEKKLTILKKSVVGFATVNKDLLTIEQTGPGAISLTIPGNKGTGNILYYIGGSVSEETGFPAKALALVKTNCVFGANDTVDTIIEKFKEKGYYSYNNFTGEAEFVPEYAEGVKPEDKLKDDIIVIAAYDVSGNKTAINNYNFSGFTVSNSNVEISGLYI